MTQTLRVRVTRRAAREIERAAAWWEENRSLAPGAVHEELEQAFLLLQSQPHIGAVAQESKLNRVRRIHLSRIHFHLYYRETRTTIDVLALWHTSRGTGPRT